MAQTLRNMLVRVGADITGLKSGLKNAQSQVKFFGRNVSGSMKEMKSSMAGLAGALGGGLLIKGGIQDAQRYEALMATLGESMGNSRKDFEKWSETVGQSMGYSRLQSADTANLLSLNFKKIATSQQDLVDKTTKMMETAAIISNKRGMTMQEVSDRIRSAMNQEADGADELGVNVRIAAVQTSKAYQELGNNQPWDKLSESMRKTILYHHILQQVSENLGSTMQDTTAARMAMFTASLTDVRMALGQAFLPIMYTVLPILTRLSQALYRALQYVAAFMRALFGGGFKYKAPVTKADVAATESQAKALDGVGGAAEKAGKKSAKAAKKTKEAWSGTFGFDEVHTVKDPEEPAAGGAGGGAGGGGGGAGGLGDMEMPEMPTNPFEPFSEGIDKLAQKMKKFAEPLKKAWDIFSAYFKNRIAVMGAWWTEHKDQIIQAWNNVVSFVMPILSFLGRFIWESIKGVVSGVIRFFQGIIEFFTGVFTGDWQLAWEGLKNIFYGAFQAVWNFFNLSFIGGLRKGLTTFVVDGLKSVKGFADDFIKFVKELGTNTKKFITDFKEAFTNALAYVLGLIVRQFVKIALVLDDFARNCKTAAGNAWKAIKDVFWDAVGWFSRTIITPIVNEFEKIKNAFSRGIGEGFKYIVNRAIDGFNSALGVFNRLKNKTPLKDEIPDLRIPRLARGGITTGPTLAMVGDNPGGREVISPLDRLEGMLTNSVMRAIELTGGGGGSSADIVLNIDGRRLARIVKPLLDAENRRVGTNVRLNPI
jgi:hypothetical protein